MQDTVSNHFKYNIHGRVKQIHNHKNLVVEKENELFQIKIASEEDFVDFEFLNASNNRDNLTEIQDEISNDERPLCEQTGFINAQEMSKVLAVVARDSSVAYYKINTGFITTESGLKKIPYDLKTSGRESDDDQELND